jgi:hypothetical protein
MDDNFWRDAATEGLEVLSSINRSLLIISERLEHMADPLVPIFQGIVAADTAGAASLADIATQLTALVQNLQNNPNIPAADVTAAQGILTAVQAAATSAASEDTTLQGINAGLGGAGSPVITSLTPNTGPAAGGTPVALVGAGFSGANLAINFGVTAATQVVVQSDEAATCTSPAGTDGVVPVTATTAVGTSTGVPFTYAN